MKSLLCLVFFAGFATLATAQQNESKPSKEETLAWLRDKFASYTINDTSLPKFGVGLPLELSAWDEYLNVSNRFGPELKQDTIFGVFLESSLYKIGGRFQRCFYEIPICEIESVSIYTAWGGTKFICLRTLNDNIHIYKDAQTFTREFGIGGEFKDVWDDNKRSQEFRQTVYVPFQVNRETDLIKRINTATQHIKTFCPEKPKEAF